MLQNARVAAAFTFSELLRENQQEHKQELINRITDLNDKQADFSNIYSCNKSLENNINSNRGGWGNFYTPIGFSLITQKR